MNSPFVNEIMPKVREWLALPLDQAKASIVSYMKDEGIYEKLDFELVDVSESAEEAIGLVFGI